MEGAVRSDSLKEWIKFQKKKWQFQAWQRREEGGKKARTGVTSWPGRREAGRQEEAFSDRPRGLVWTHPGR